ncbi:unnamed protein product [Polarella glacialis]|uniref:Uncharacterized protein n=1 Tax=Polarella glacialis TaxID=89957 RepID=A0A813GR28_POLGL|nr:unnamed protein product [Polarella glacialis]
MPATMLQLAAFIFLSIAVISVAVEHLAAAADVCESSACQPAHPAPGVKVLLQKHHKVNRFESGGQEDQNASRAVPVAQDFLQVTIQKNDTDSMSNLELIGRQGRQRRVAVKNRQKVQSGFWFQDVRSEMLGPVHETVEVDFPINFNATAASNEFDMYLLDFSSKGMRCVEILFISVILFFLFAFFILFRGDEDARKQRLLSKSQSSEAYEPVSKPQLVTTESTIRDVTCNQGRKCPDSQPSPSPSLPTGNLEVGSRVEDDACVAAGRMHEVEGAVKHSSEIQAEIVPFRLKPGSEHTGAEVVVEALRLAGVRRLFGIPGVQNLALYGAMCTQPSSGRASEDEVAMHLIGNEEAAAFLAWGAWHGEGRLACVCIIGGPGVTHALSGIACAHRDHTPMLVLTAGVRSGKERFQLHDVDNLAVLRPVCKALFRPTTVAEIGPMMAQACRSAMEGRPGPVGVEIACDLYNRQGPFEWPELGLPAGPGVTAELEALVAPTLRPGVKSRLLSAEPLVGLIRALTNQAARAGLTCTVVAEPGRCAIAAAAAHEPGAAWKLLCPGSCPSGAAAEGPGIAVPSAIGVARALAGQAGSQFMGIAVSVQEENALLPQGLELSHAGGLPLIVLTVPALASFKPLVDVATLATSLGFVKHAVFLSMVPDIEATERSLSAALSDAASGRTCVLQGLADVQFGVTPAAITEDHELSEELAEELAGAASSLVTSLLAAGVRVLCAAAKNSALQRLLKELAKASEAQGGGLQVVPCTDAQSVGFVADGAARCFAGGGTSVAACLVDSVDPFGLPTLSGVGEAWQDGVPVLLLVLSGEQMGPVGRAEDFAGPLREFSKEVLVAPTSQESWAEQVAKAAALAAATPAGPVTLLLPRSALMRGALDGPRGPPLLQRCCSDLLATMPARLKAPAVPPATPPLLPAAGAQAAVSLLLAARRPWIHVGMGAAKAASLVQQLAETLEAPVSSTFSGKGVLREDHPLWFWSIAGSAMPPVLQQVADTCDTVLILGAQMGEIASCRGQWPGKRFKVIHVDWDITVLGANFTPDVSICGDVGELVEHVLSILRQKGVEPTRRTPEGKLHDPGLRGELRAAHEALRAQMKAEAGLALPGQCSPFGLYGALQAAVPPDSAVFVADSGNGTVLSAEFLRLAAPRHYMAPTDFSSMGYCVPAAIGAALAGRATGQDVISVATVGDGAFLMTGMEMATAAALRLPVICVILRDGELGMISGLQRAQQSEVYCTHVPELLDLEGVGKSLGVATRRITSDAEALEVASWAYGLCSSGHGPVFIDASICYGAPSFYARGATGQEPSGHTVPGPAEALPSAQINAPRNKQLDEMARAWARDELARRRENGAWDVAECLRSALAQQCDRPSSVQQIEASQSAAVESPVDWTYAELAQRVFSLQAALLAAGVRPGQRVGVMLPNIATHMVAHFAIVSPGMRGVVLNLSPRLKPPELAVLLEDAAPSAMLLHADSAALLAETVPLLAEALCNDWPVFWVGGVPEAAFNKQELNFDAEKAMLVQRKDTTAWPSEDPDHGTEASSPCEMYFTSGTSGRPKGVILSHEIVHCHALACISEHRFTSSDVWLHVAPMFHLVDAFAMFSVTAVGGSHVLLPGAFDPERTLGTVWSHGITATNMAASMVNLVLASPSSRSSDGRFPSLRLVSCGGAPLSQESILRAQRLFGCEFFQSYGMTECCGKISMSMLGPEQRARPLGEQLSMLCSSGKPFEAIDIRVADTSTGEVVPSDGKTVGEVQIRGPTVFKGYLKPGTSTPVANSEHFLPGGWFRTGDLATVSPDGFLRVCDRLKDMILVGSENVYCIEVENTLASHPDVALCSVYGIPGPEVIGELVKAVVLLREGAAVPSVQDIQKFCSSRLADFKVPRMVEFVASLPLNSSGKVIKAELKKKDGLASQNYGPIESVVDESGLDGCNDRGWPAELADHCYDIAWQLKPLVLVVPSAAHWLILSPSATPMCNDPGELVEAVAQQFRSHGATVSLAQCIPGDPPMVSGASSEEPCTGICLLLPGSTDDDSSSRAEADEAMRLRVRGNLCALLAAVRTATERHVSTIIVATQQQYHGLLLDGRPLSPDPAVAATWSFVRSAAAESNSVWRLIELCSHATVVVAAGAVVAEAESAFALGGDAAEEVEWSRGSRWVPRLQRMPEPLPASAMPVSAGFLGARADGSSCVVVGGNGSLGRLLVGHIASCGQLRDIVVVGRRAASENTLLPELANSSCKVHLRSADTGDAEGCAGLMRYVQQEAAPCLNVLNLAGFLPDSGMVPLAKDLRWADCVPVLRPKVDATINLAAAGDDALPKDCALVCFSSIFGLLSYPRLAPYGAANGFQDGFTEARVAKGRRSLAVSWGAWAETGMAHRAGSGFHAFWRSEGMGFVPPKAGMEILCRLLAQQRCPRHLAVLPSAETGPWPAWLWRHVLARGIADQPNNSDAEMATGGKVAVASNTNENIVADIRGVVVKVLSTLLGCSDDEVPMGEPFATAGITSMMAVDLTSRVGQALSISLPATLAFEVVSAEQLCECLEARLRPKVRKAAGVDAAGNGAVGLRAPQAAAVTVSIVGGACTLPGGPQGSVDDLQQVWQNLVHGHDCISPPPQGRPVAAPRESSPASELAGYSDAGYLDAAAVTCFDPAAFGISRSEAEIVDPQQRLCLKAAREAMEDGGCGITKGASIGVYVGVTTVDFTMLVMAKAVPPSAYTGPALTTAICSNRISYVFDLQGPSMSIDTACSSSLLSANLAMSGLRNGHCTSALVMGVNVQFDPYWTEAFAVAGMLSPTGRCRFGDNNADGYVRGEGCACLMFTAASRADGLAPAPYAQARGSYSNQDGRSNGLTAPNPAAQAALITAAWQDAGLLPSMSVYSEAHGTGTALGDPIEIVALGRALRGRGGGMGDPTLAALPPIRTTSFKSNIGHLECAAGAASLTKLMMVLQQSMIPPSLHLRQRNQHINWDDVAVSVITECDKLMAASASEGVAGSVSGFGFGGTNANAVLQACESESGPVKRPRPRAERRLYAVALAAGSGSPLVDSACRIKAWAEAVLVEEPDGGAASTALLTSGIDAVARAAAQRVSRLPLMAAPCRAVLVASSLIELVGKVATLIDESTANGSQLLSIAKPQRIALVLSSQSSESGAFAAYRLLGTLAQQGVKRGAEASEEALPWAGLHKVTSLLGAMPRSSPAAAYASLRAAAAAFIEDLGVVPFAIIGHGLAGEAAALAAAGAIGLEDGLALASAGQVKTGARGDWPPTVPVASSRAGAFNVLPGEDHWRMLSATSLAAVPSTVDCVVSAAQALHCTAIVEVCIGPSMLAGNNGLQGQQTVPFIASSCLGPPVDGRMVAGNVTERAILEASAAIFAAGGEVSFARVAGTGPVSRLPPRALAPQLCWPGNPSSGERKRQEQHIDAFHAEWSPAPLQVRSCPGRRFQVFGPGPVTSAGGLVAGVAQALLQQGCAVEVAASKEAVRLAPAGTEFVFAFAALPGMALQDLLGTTRDVPHSLLQWLRALSQLQPAPGGKIHAEVISIGAHSSEADLAAVPAAALWGAARSARLELSSDMELRCVDLTPSLTAEAAAARLVTELLCGQGEVRDVLLGDGEQRAVRVLRSLQITLGSPSSGGLQLPPAFAITGGTGALGLMLAEWLALHGTKRVVLASRSAKVSDDHKELWAAIADTQAAVELCQCDVGSDPQVLSSHRFLTDGAPFGIAHLAGCLHDGLFMRQNREILDMSMRPKVDGAALLMEALRASPSKAALQMQHLWLFSSVTSCMGNFGQTAYGAASSALDAMAQAWSPGHARGPVRGAAMALQWGPWAGFGMAANLSSSSTSSFKLWQRGQAFGALEAVLRKKNPQPQPAIVCLTRFDWANMSEELRAGGSTYHQHFFEQLVQPYSTEKKQQQQLVPVLPDMRVIVMESLQRFLPNGSAGLTDDAEFDELGLDSLAGVEASRSLAAALGPFGVEGVKPTLLFEANNLRCLMQKLKLPPQAAVVQRVEDAHDWQQAVQQQEAFTLPDIRSIVMETLQRFLPNGSAGLTDDAEFDELGLDSLAGVEASRSLAAALGPFGVEGVKPTLLFEANNLRSLMQKLKVPNSGLARSVQVADSWQQAVQPQQEASTLPDIRFIVMETLQRFLPNGAAGLTDDAEFDELGLDSLSGVEASRSLAAALGPFGVEGIKPTLLFEVTSLNRLLDKLKSSRRVPVRQAPVAKSATAISGPNLQHSNLTSKPSVLTRLQLALSTMHHCSGPVRMLLGFVDELVSKLLLALLSFVTFLLSFFVMLGIIGDQTMLISQSGQIISRVRVIELVFVFRVAWWSLSLPFLWIVKTSLVGQQRAGLSANWSLREILVRIVEKFEELVFTSYWTFFQRTELQNVWYRIMGAQIGSGAYIAGHKPPQLWDLLSVGENTMLDTVYFPRNGAHTLRMNDKVSIGNNVICGFLSAVMDGARVGDGTVVVPNSTAHGDIPAGSVVCDSEVCGASPWEIDESGLLSTPRRTHMASGAAAIFILWRCVVDGLLLSIFLPELCYVFDVVAGHFAPSWRFFLMGVDSNLGPFEIAVFILPPILLAAYFLMMLVDFVVAVAAKRLLLGRLAEGALQADNWWLLRFELCYLLTSSAVMTFKSQTFQTLPNTIFMKLLGGNVAWSWMPSPMTPAAYLSADLVTIESNHFTASCSAWNCISLNPPTLKQPRWMVSCRSLTLGKDSFLGPSCIITGGSSLGQGSATMDMTYVPAGTDIKPGKTMMGTTLSGVMAKKKSEKKIEPGPVLPYHLATCATMLCANVVDTWLLVAITSTQSYLCTACVSSSIFTDQRFFAILLLVSLFSPLIFAFLVVVSKNLILGRVSEHSGGRVRGWQNLKWQCAIICMQKFSPRLFSFSYTPLVNVILRLCGATIGSNVQANMIIGCTAPEMDLLTLEDDSYIGGIIYGHEFGSGALEFKRVTFGKGSKIMGAASATPGTSVPDSAICWGRMITIPGAPGKSEKAPFLSGIPARPWEAPSADTQVAFT